MRHQYAKVSEGPEVPVVTKPVDDVMNGMGAASNASRTRVYVSIPVYSRIYHEDCTDAFYIDFLQKYDKPAYQKYQDLLAGKTTIPQTRRSKKDLFGAGIPVKEKSNKDIATNFLRTAGAAKVWDSICVNIKVQVQNMDGSLEYQEFPIPVNQINFPGNYVANTGNPVDENFSDNGVMILPIALCANYFCSMVFEYLIKAMFFNVGDRRVYYDASSLFDDMNAKGTCSIYYNPPGDMSVVSWDNLRSQMNANFQQTYGMAEKSATGVIIINNEITHGQNMQVLPVSKNNFNNVYNSAGTICLLTDKRDQSGKNPCFRQIPGGVINKETDVPLITNCGYVKYEFDLYCVGQNPNAGLLSTLYRLGSGVINGDFVKEDEASDTLVTEEMRQLLALKNEPQGNNTNCNIICDDESNTRIGGDDLPILGVGINEWVQQAYGNNTNIPGKRIGNLKNISFYLLNFKFLVEFCK